MYIAMYFQIPSFLIEYRDRFSLCIAQKYHCLILFNFQNRYRTVRYLCITQCPNNKLGI